MPERVEGDRAYPGELALTAEEPAQVGGGERCARFGWPDQITVHPAEVGLLTLSFLTLLAKGQLVDAHARQDERAP